MRLHRDKVVKRHSFIPWQAWCLIPSCVCGITGSGSGATAALGPAPAIATAIALALTATAIALDPANTSSASSLCYLCCPSVPVFFHSVLLLRKLLLNHTAWPMLTHSILTCAVWLCYSSLNHTCTRPWLLFLPTEILFHCLCIVRARKLTTRLLRRNKELIMHFRAENMMTLHCASWTQLHRARNLILL